MNEPDRHPPLLPVLFLGHGSPLTAFERNRFTEEWRRLGAALPRPRAILCISAHWESRGLRISTAVRPSTIHDFYGFPPELYEFSYPAAGLPHLHGELREALESAGLPPPIADPERGLDHGCWCPLSVMYPQADIPVVELSLDDNLPPESHFRLAASLTPLRKSGVLIILSGNIVHNLGMLTLQGRDFYAPHGFDWAIRAERKIMDMVSSSDIEGLLSFGHSDPDIALAAPTPEHYLPLCYALSLKEHTDSIHWFGQGIIAGSLSMASFLLDSQ